MSDQVGVQGARRHLAEILERAHRGEAIVVTKRGRAYATIAPVERATPPPASPLSTLRGSGRGLWGDDPSGLIDDLREEWG